MGMFACMQMPWMTLELGLQVIVKPPNRSAEN